MTETTKKTITPSYHKALRQEVEEKITAALTGLKENIGDKKLKERIEKAAKVIVKGIKKPVEAKPVTKKKAAVAKKTVKTAKKVIKKTASKAKKVIAK